MCVLRGTSEGVGYSPTLIFLIHPVDGTSGSKHSSMSKAIQNARLEALNTFLKETPPERLSQNLRNMLLEFLIEKPDEYSFDIYYLLQDVLNLFVFLDELKDKGE